MAKGVGKIFEEDIKKSIDEDRCLLIRLNDQPQSFEKTARFSLKNPCDFLLFDSLTKLFVPVELKSTKYRSMGFEDIKEENPKSALIHKHQIEGLLKFSKYNGVKSGFLLNFRTDEVGIQRTYFIKIQDFINMCEKINKKSFNEIDLLTIGNAIKLNGDKKRTRYKWCINELLDELSLNN